MAKWLTRLLFDWFFVLLYKLFRALLVLVNFMEKIFDVFAGITKVSYNGQKDYLVNVFFGQNIIAVIFWGMTAISVVLCFVFTVVSVARKILDIGGGVKQSLGQILNGALRSCISFLFVSVICIASVNLANICLIRIDYLMSNASTLLYDGDNVKHFTGEENAAMTRIMNTIANYSVNSSTENRYNINLCFNSIREDMLFLQQQQFFSYEYPLVDGHHTWQSAIALIAGAGDIGNDLELETVDSSVAEALTTVMDEIKYNTKFRPLETASRPDQGKISVSNTIFLVSSMEAANSSVYRNNPSFDDALRRSYVNGTKSYENLKQVRKDFDIWEMRYDVGYITCVVFIVIMTQCIFLFILRLFDLLLLYLAAPAFVSTIPLDDGMRFQTWRQAFTIKVISGFGSVMAMRLYLVLIQVIMDGKLRFFEDSATNYLCQLLFILGGSYAVLKASPLLTQIVAGNSGAAANSEALSAALGGIVGGKAVQAAGLGLKAAEKVVQAPGQIFRGIRGIHQRNRARIGAKHMSDEGLKLKEKSKEKSGGGDSEGNLADLQSPQSRSMGAAAGFLAGAVAGSGAAGGKGGGKGGASGGGAGGKGNKFSSGSGGRSTGGGGAGGKGGAKGSAGAKGGAAGGKGGAGASGTAGAKGAAPGAKGGGAGGKGGAGASGTSGGKGGAGTAGGSGGAKGSAQGTGASGSNHGGTGAGASGGMGRRGTKGSASGAGAKGGTAGRAGAGASGGSGQGGAKKGTSGGNRGGQGGGNRNRGGSASAARKAAAGRNARPKTNQAPRLSASPAARGGKQGGAQKGSSGVGSSTASGAGRAASGSRRGTASGGQGGTAPEGGTSSEGNKAHIGGGVTQGRNPGADASSGGAPTDAAASGRPAGNGVQTAGLSGSLDESSQFVGGVTGARASMAQSTENGEDTESEGSTFDGGISGGQSAETDGGAGGQSGYAAEDSAGDSVPGTGSAEGNAFTAGGGTGNERTSASTGGADAGSAGRGSAGAGADRGVGFASGAGNRSAGAGTDRGVSFVSSAGNRSAVMGGAGSASTSGTGTSGSSASSTGVGGGSASGTGTSGSGASRAGVGGSSASGTGTSGSGVSRAGTGGSGTSGTGAPGGTAAGTGSNGTAGGRSVTGPGAGSSTFRAGASAGAGRVSGTVPPVISGGGRPAPAAPVSGGRLQTTSRGPKLSGRISAKGAWKGSPKWAGGTSQRGRQPRR